MLGGEHNVKGQAADLLSCPSREMVVASTWSNSESEKWLHLGCISKVTPIGVAIGVTGKEGDRGGP